MTTPTGFSSWSSFLQFGLAREFVLAESDQPPPEIPVSRLERLGHAISRPLLNPVNFLLREIKNPLVILSLTVSLVALATLVFYPAEFMMVVYTVLPFLAKVQPWMVKLAVFIGVETTISAVGMRALGRMCNRELRAAWHAGRIVPVHMGGRKIIG